MFGIIMIFFDLTNNLTKEIKSKIKYPDGTMLEVRGLIEFNIRMEKWMEPKSM